MESSNPNDETTVPSLQQQEDDEDVQQQTTTMGNQPSTSTTSGNAETEAGDEGAPAGSEAMEQTTTTENEGGGGQGDPTASDDQQIQQPNTNTLANDQNSEAEEGEGGRGDTTVSHGQQIQQPNALASNQNAGGEDGEGGEATASHGQQNHQPSANTLTNNQNADVEDGGDVSAGSQLIEPTTTTSNTENGAGEASEVKQTEETNDVVNIDENLIITNGEDAPVSFGHPDRECCHLLYCGRSRGDDRWCGPEEGRQCTSCVEIQQCSNKKMDMLRVVFPTLTEDIFVAALREKRGDIYESAQYLIDLGAPHLPLEQAFPRFVSLGANDTPPLRVAAAAQVGTIQTMMDYNTDDELKRKVVESALRRQRNNHDPETLISGAVDYLFETNEERLQQNVLDDEAQQSAHEQEQLAKAVARINVLMDRNREIQRVKQMPMPDAVRVLAIASFEEKPTSTTADDLSNGHCMTQYTSANAEDGTSPFCRICACQPPGRFTGTSLCRTCGICEGCISSNMMFHCPSIGNGCHVHPHPLQILHPASSRRRTCCSVRGEGCLERVAHHGRYGCGTCSFTVCKICISKDAPTHYDRYRGRIVELPQLPPAQQQDTTEENASSSTVPRFDPSERAVAAQWGDGMQLDEDEPPFVVGTGQVAMRAPAQNRRGSSTDGEVQRRTVATGRVDRETLNPENSRALERFSNSVSTVACDIHHVEHLLMLAQQTTTTTGHSSNMPRAIREAVTAGKVGIAGTFLLANQYAPKGLLQKRKSRNDADDEMVCFCGGVVDLDTAPDGAVGCLNGHGMHAGCAADHLLGGGGCPFCNSPLFFPNIPSTEVEAAKALAQMKLEERKMNIETETATRNVELSAEGLDILPKLNDLVRISSDFGICAVELTKYAERCGWNPCMKEYCGMIGRVSRVLVSSDNGDATTVACRVHIDNHQDYFWTPSVLTVVCRADSNEYVLFKEANITEGVGGSSELVAAAKAENHISLLRAELKVLVAARLELEDTTKGMTVSTDSDPAVAAETNSDQLSSLQKVKSIVSHFDWCRAKHLFRLTDRWGDAEKATGARQLAIAAVREGDIDSASRIIRRYNATEMVEDLQWKDAAVSEGKEYLVEEFAKVDLYAWPSAGAPKTGYVLDPSARFFSRTEINDDDGNLWVQVDDTLLAALPKYEGLPPPQGWICTKPGGPNFPALVRCARSALRCFGCGDGLVPVGRPKTYFAVKPDHGLTEGDDLLVAATLEPVQVVSLEEEGNFVVCSFSNQSNSHQKKQKASQVGQCNFTARYRRADLVYPGGRGGGMGQKSKEEQRILIAGDDCLCSRRDLIRKHDGDAIAARKVWEDAKNLNVCGILDSDSSSFASCVRGHLLHARCFQAALLGGQCCPAPGCAEPLWVPRVRRGRVDDDTTCCGANGTTEVDVDDEDEIVGLTTFMNSGRATDSEADRNLPVTREMKMCPLCYSGPFIHTECDDMAAHHGQCVRRALGQSRCSFSVQPGEIATTLMGLSPDESIVAALPKCPEHDVPVMFNGCLNCGHVFTQTSWGDLPAWDPTAKAAMNVDKEKREQAKLLADHIREESSILQFDRDALEDTWGKAIDIGQEAVENALSSLPPVPPPADEFL